MQKVRIEYYRSQKGWTQQELADMAGVSIHEIMAYERYFESPKLDKAIAIANALGVTLSDLVKEV